MLIETINKDQVRDNELENIMIHVQGCMLNSTFIINDPIAIDV